MADNTTNPVPEIVHVGEGPVPAAAWRRADQVVSRLANKAPRPILFARMKIRLDEDRDPDQKAVVQATLDVSGDTIRAQVAAPTPQQALDTLFDRMDRRLRKLAEQRRDRSRRPTSTGEGSWRSGDLPTARPDFYPRPREDRRIIRRKTFAPDDRISWEEAVFDLDVLDYRFFLFNDEDDGQASVVYEDDGGVRLQRLSGGTPSYLADGAPIEVNPTPPPELTEEEASSRLDVTDAPFIFFRNHTTRDGNVLYRRYDGHYGLIEPRPAR